MGKAGASDAGKLINVDSVLSDRAMIFQDPYCASKHALKGFADSLRMELEEDGESVSVTLIKPGAIDTPYIEHAGNHMETEGRRNPPLSYDPTLMVDAIDHACENDPRDLVIGSGWILGKLGQLAPALTYAAMKDMRRFLQTSTELLREGTRDHLYGPVRDGSVRSSSAAAVGISEPLGSSDLKGNKS